MEVLCLVEKSKAISKCNFDSCSVLDVVAYCHNMEASLDFTSCFTEHPIAQLVQVCNVRIRPIQPTDNFSQQSITLSLSWRESPSKPISIYFLVLLLNN